MIKRNLIISLPSYFIVADSLPALSPRYPDPVDYCEHIQGEIKRVQQKVATKSIAETLTEDQLREEREIQRQQLADIFRLMQEQQDRFGIGTMDDMQEQMRLYAVWNPGSFFFLQFTERLWHMNSVRGYNLSIRKGIFSILRRVQNVMF